MTDDKKTPMVLRPPVVVIMGHIDHGKTTLLDYIRSTYASEEGSRGTFRPVAGRESGGITQHIGAYEIERNGKKITFVDTPGHEAFSRMRSRGARVADVGVLLVAADDGVKPQTIEALEALQAAKIPFVVALNKVDRTEADPNRVKGELAEHNVMLEGWGGTIPVAEISARTGTGVSDLIDLLLLVTEMEELTADLSQPAQGVVIESYLDRQRGAVATLLIKNGTLRKGDWVAAGREVANIKTVEDGEGVLCEEVTVSAPVRVLGFSAPPPIGALFSAYADKKEAQTAAEEYKKTSAQSSTDVVSSGEQAMYVPLVLKADVAGSEEALQGEIQKLAGVRIRAEIMKSGVGDITDDDIRSVADATGAIVIGFKVRVLASAKTLAERHGVTIQTFDVIYDLLNWLKDEFMHRVPVEKERIDEGKLKVLKIFKRGEKKIVFGGIVTAGVLRNGAKFDVPQGERVAGTGTIINVQQSKMDTKEVGVNKECGVEAEFAGMLEEGDSIVLYSEKELPKVL